MEKREPIGDLVGPRGPIIEEDALQGSQTPQNSPIRAQNPPTLAAASPVEAKPLMASKSAAASIVVAKAVPKVAKPSKGSKSKSSVEKRPGPTPQTEARTTDSLDNGLDREAQVDAAERRKFFITAIPGWLISLIAHVGFVLILAAISISPIKSVINILDASMGEDEMVLEDFELQGPAMESTESFEESFAASESSTAVEMPPVAAPELASFESSIDDLKLDSITESVIPSQLLNSSSVSQLTAALGSRSSTAAKGEMLERFGGNANSEKAVALALKWIAAHQARDGGWNFAHTAICRGQCMDPGHLTRARNGATAMALLPFLGAGQTHLEGEYKDTIKRGLGFLIQSMRVTTLKGIPHGSWHEPGGRTYSHSLAAIAICEAYAMTRDYDLAQPAQLSLNYLIYAQDPRGGGWRYNPQQAGDTSVVGWCLMALKSGKMGNLEVPDATLKGAGRFLDYVSTNYGAFYGYDEPTAKRRQSTTAVGLLCRMYLGYPKYDVGIQQGVEFLSQRGPSLSDLYYTYYATQVMRHHGGEEWKKWNSQLRDKLIARQEKQGHAAGSWIVQNRHASQGGRLYATSLATMILEVYYRHLPLYSEGSLGDDFEI